MFRRASVGLACTALAVGLFAGAPASAQDPAKNWPERSVKLILPYAPGGATDLIGRPWAEKLSQAFGQQFVIENRGGASGMIGTEAAAKSAPDGYSFLLTPNNPLSILPLLRKTPYDPVKSFLPVGRVGDLVKASEKSRGQIRKVLRLDRVGACDHAGGSEAVEKCRRQRKPEECGYRERCKGSGAPGLVLRASADQLQGPCVPRAGIGQGRPRGKAKARGQGMDGMRRQVVQCGFALRPYEPQECSGLQGQVETERRPIGLFGVVPSPGGPELDDKPDGVLDDKSCSNVQQVELSRLPASFAPARSVAGSPLSWNRGEKFGSRS